MEWNEICEIVLGVLASVGGIGGIILVVIKLSSNIIADRLTRKYALKLNKDLEYYKNNLDKKNYISKTRFNKEFEIYQDLSMKMFNMGWKTRILFPNGIDMLPQDDRKRLEETQKRHDEALNSFNVGNMSLMANAPFISENVCHEFEEIRDLCRLQINQYPYCGALAKYISNSVEPDATTVDECRKRTLLILTKQQELTQKIRKYLNSLEVLEN